MGLFMHKRLNLGIVVAGLSVLLLICMVAGISIGETPIDFGTVIAILVQPLTGAAPTWSPATGTIVMSIRLPRVVLAALVGAGLAISGACLQSLFRNPMASPFILGISNGAALGASLVLLYGISFGVGIFNLPVAAFICGISTILLVYEIARVGNLVPVDTLLLSGIAIAAFLSACTSFMLFTSSQNLHQIIFWMMGGLWGRTWEHVIMLLPFTVVGTAILLSLSRPLNALMFGEESAQYLGIEVEHLKKILLIVSAAITSAAVAVSGIIGFVGLITPHVVRLVVGPDHRVLLPVCTLTGAIFLIAADLISRLIIAPAEMPIGVITAICGAPFFIYLLKKRRSEE